MVGVKRCVPGGHFKQQHAKSPPVYRETVALYNEILLVSIHEQQETKVTRKRSQCISFQESKKGKGSPYSITERRVPELIPVLGSQPAGDVSHKPDGRLPLLSARPVVTPATLKRAATSFAAW